MSCTVRRRPSNLPNTGVWKRVRFRSCLHADLLVLGVLLKLLVNCLESLILEILAIRLDGLVGGLLIVDGPVFCREGFAADGEVVFRRAHITGFLDLSGARLSIPVAARFSRRS